ncbi:sigma-like protein [Streptomyces sp. NPDC038707]|uniref:sigma-like protein n=1 Tax=unclassified Streptomyces TaxID=2593676 RepID=UPI00340D6D86
MSETKITEADITTLDSHAPAPPISDKLPITDDGHASAPSEDAITTLDSHAPAPPALDLTGK